MCSTIRPTHLPGVSEPTVIVFVQKSINAINGLARAFRLCLASLAFDDLHRQRLGIVKECQRKDGED